MQTVRKGSSGDDVRTLQTMLNLVGFVLDIDGQFGSQTETAVRAFQAKKGLTIDGIAGPQTWNALMAATNIPTQTGVTPSGTVPVVIPQPTPSGIPEIPTTPTTTYQPQQTTKMNFWLYVAIGAIIYYYKIKEEETK